MDYVTVQLTNDMDKALMNRPFYWHYIEKTGGIPNPQKLAFITGNQTPKDIKTEQIHFGSARLHQIFSITKKWGGMIRLYENRPGTDGSHIPLIPWIGLNLKISYKCDRKKDSFRSIGLNLISGVMVENFHDQLLSMSKGLTAKIPDYCFTLSPLIKPLSGIKRIEQLIMQEINADDHSWADEAIERWRKDEELLDSFYEEIEDKPESYYTEKDALRDQYEPKIDVRIINGGIFYLAK